MGVIRMLLFALAAVLAYTVFKRMISPHKAVREDYLKDDRLGRLVQDPQCGVYVDSDEAVRRKVPDGELFFCSKACAETYLEKAHKGE